MNSKTFEELVKKYSEQVEEVDKDMRQLNLQYQSVLSSLTFKKVGLTAQLELCKTFLEKSLESEKEDTSFSKSND